MKCLWLPATLLVFALVPERACNGVQETSGGAPEEPRHLHLVLQVEEHGAAEVTSAAEVPGAAVLPDAYTGDFLWLVRRDGRLLAAGSVPDPFESRAFAPPGSSSEARGHLGPASVVVKVPDGRLDGPLDMLAVELYRLRPAADGSAVPRIDPETVDRLQKEGRLERIAGLSGQALAAQIRRVGRKAPG